MHSWFLRPVDGLGSGVAAACPSRRKLVWVRVGVTEISWDGTIRRRALDTWCLADADRCEHVIGQILTLPPAYQVAPGRPVYIIHTSDRAVLIGKEDLYRPAAGLSDHDPGDRRPSIIARRRAGTVLSD
jgi:hypothetical protein